MKLSRRLSSCVITAAVAATGLALPGSAPSASAATATTPVSRFGSSINSPDDVARISGLMGRPLTSVRVFFNGTPALWSNSALLNSIPANGTAVVSFESGTPAQIQTFLAGHPSTMKCYATYWHEPEDNFTTPTQQAAYRASWHQYAPAIRAAGCIPTLILLKWSLNPNSGWDWHWWYPQGDVDLLAFDAYNGSVKKASPTYTDPVKFVAPMVAVSASTGLPWAMAEVGSYIVGTAADRAAWAHGVAVQAASYHVPFANWWDQFGTDGIKDFTLDQATAAAWNVLPAGPPAVPSAVSLTSGATSVGVSWTAPDSGGSAITGYSILSQDVATGTTTTTPVAAPATNGTVTGLTAGRSYSITVTASNSLGTSQPSAAQIVVPGTLVTVPSAPTIGVAAPGNTTASVAWTPPGSNGGSSISGYTVTAVNTASPADVQIKTVGSTTTTATVMGLTNGQLYTLTVTAANGLGNSAASAPSNAVMPATLAAAPTVGSATAGNASVSLSWAAPAADGGSPITGYRITAVNASNQQVGSTVVAGSATSGTVTGLTNGRSVAAKVAAINAIGDSPASAVSNYVTPVTVPDIPALGVSTGGVKTDAVVSATAYWILPTSNGGSPITGYQVMADRYSGTTLVSSTESAVQPDTARKLQFVGLVTAATYRFRVRAINAAGASAYSAPSNLASAY